MIYGLFILGSAGVIITIIGETIEERNYLNYPPRSWEKFDPQLVQEITSYKSFIQKSSQLIAMSQAKTEQEKMLVLYHLVTNYFTHGDQAKHNLYSNWIMSLVGVFYPMGNFIRVPEAIVNNGHSALCSQQSRVLGALASNFGVNYRLIDLQGHVVVEVWYNDDMAYV